MQIDIQKLLGWNTHTHRAFRDLIYARPEILALPSDIRESTTVGDTLQHIVAAELRYAQRLSAQPETDYAAIPKSTIDELHATHLRANELLSALLADRSYDWQQELSFVTRSAGALCCTRETVLLHTVTHSIRHHAQLATLLRQHGHKLPQPSDYLFLFATRPE